MAPTVHHIPSMSVPFSPFYEHDQELEDKKNVTNNINAALSAEIDFFGGTDALLDQDGEEEGDDGENEPNGGGMPFIPDGKTSFSSPEIYDIWDIDPLEVARQSTLVDQAIFITIPLSSSWLISMVSPDTYLRPHQYGNLLIVSMQLVRGQLHRSLQGRLPRIVQLFTSI